MKTNNLIEGVHRTLSRSKALVYLAAKLQNQTRAVIKHYLTDGINSHCNGEEFLLRSFTGGDSTFFDVGANVGDWTDIYLKSRPGSAHGVLFEPSRSAVAQLQERYSHLKNIEIVEAAVAEVPGPMKFFEEPGAGQTSSLAPGFSGRDARLREVNVTTIDVEAEKRGLPYIDFLKVDVEGFDLNVIKGTRNLLSQERIGLIQFEYTDAWAIAGNTLRSAFDWLGSFGYEAFLLRKSGLYKLKYKLYGEYFTYSNFVAASPRRLQDVKDIIRGEI